MPTPRQFHAIEHAYYAERSEQWAREDFDELVEAARLGDTIGIERARESIILNAKYAGLWAALAKQIDRR